MKVAVSEQGWCLSPSSLLTLSAYIPSTPVLAPTPPSPIPSDAGVFSSNITLIPSIFTAFDKELQSLSQPKRVSPSYHRTIPPLTITTTPPPQFWDLNCRKRNMDRVGRGGGNKLSISFGVNDSGVRTEISSVVRWVTAHDSERFEIVVFRGLLAVSNFSLPKSNQICRLSFSLPLRHHSTGLAKSEALTWDRIVGVADYLHPQSTLPCIDSLSWTRGKKLGETRSDRNEPSLREVDWWRVWLSGRRTQCQIFEPRRTKGSSFERSSKGLSRSRRCRPI